MKLFVYFPHRHCLITHNVLGTYNCDKWETKKPPLISQPYLKTEILDLKWKDSKTVQLILIVNINKCFFFYYFYIKSLKSTKLKTSVERNVGDLLPCLENSINDLILILSPDKNLNYVYIKLNQTFRLNYFYLFKFFFILT